MTVPSVTDLTAEHSGCVIIAGSHGGLVAANAALRAGARAVILNDAGIGRDRAGVAVIQLAEKAGVAAATVSHATARIGDGDDMLRRGRISVVNEVASQVGCHVSQACAECAERMATAAPRIGLLSAHNEHSENYKERRWMLRWRPGEPPVLAVDSASLVCAEDEGAIIITGSHGGLVAGSPERALRALALAAVFNDAGVGIDEAGTARLPVLNERGVAACTVAADSARIGDAESTYADGVISRTNDRAVQLGAVEGMSTRAFVNTLIGKMRGQYQAI